MATAVKAAVVGDFGVGKTSLQARLALGAPSAPETRVHTFSVGVASGGRAFEVALWDTLEQEQHGPVSALLYRKAQLVLVCFAVDDRATFESAARWAAEAREASGGALVLLVGTRADCERQVPAEEARRAAEEELGAVGYVEASAATGAGADDVLESVAAACELLAPEGQERRRLLEAGELRRLREVLLGTEQLFHATLAAKGAEIESLREQLASAPPPAPAAEPATPPRPGTPGEETEELREQVEFTRKLVDAHRNATEDLQEYAQVLNRTIAALRDKLEAKSRQLERLRRASPAVAAERDESVADLRAQLESTEHLFVESLRVKSEAQAALMEENEALRARAEQAEGLVEAAVARAEEAAAMAADAAEQADRARRVATAYYVLQDNDSAPPAEVARLDGGGIMGRRRRSISRDSS